MPRWINIIMGVIGTGLMMTFTLGLSQSISNGFAGFMGGLPFLIIVLFVICLALYNFYEDAIRSKKK